MSTVADTSGVKNWGSIEDLIQGSSAQKKQPTDANRLANKEVFLQLLVAQIKNQNPLNPSDGVEFVAQLAQFTQLEQSMSMKEDLDAIRKVLDPTTDTTTEKP
ncbi:MAG: hypothetical protein HY821_10760 [Acidobacteria bacterium]|nr:hypothetical protein [Acidobacteriota bacterium]